MKQKLRLHLALPALFFLFLLSACRREESLETGFTARYALQDTFGVCFTSNVVGTYRAGQVLGDSNYLELTLDVDVTGRYAINTDLQNGFSFTGTGAFTDTGMTTIRVPARGTPIAEGVTTLRLSQDSGYCEINVTVLGSNPANGGGSCNAVATGTFKKDTTLNASHAVSVQHNFATAGSYTVTTDTINGFYFNKAVTVVAPGTQSQHRTRPYCYHLRSDGYICRIFSLDHCSTRGHAYCGRHLPGEHRLWRWQYLCAERDGNGWQ
ncbi:MAG: hypothetical protein EOO15_17285 [Chitinophagaceae bacterium]|nr:MAG: hypothetical protein EOO15_17285 [Chitinophagaceae bacterium]